MSDTRAPAVIGSGKWWEPHRTELVGIARWIFLAWLVQTLFLSSVGLWIVYEMHEERMAAREARALAQSELTAIERAVMAHK